MRVLWDHPLFSLKSNYQQGLMLLLALYPVHPYISGSICSESLSHDAHIIYYQKRQWTDMCKHLPFLPKMAIFLHVGKKTFYDAHNIYVLPKMAMDRHIQTPCLPSKNGDVSASSLLDLLPSSFTQNTSSYSFLPPLPIQLPPEVIPSPSVLSPSPFLYPTFSSSSFLFSLFLWFHVSHLLLSQMPQRLTSRSHFCTVLSSPVTHSLSCSNSLPSRWQLVSTLVPHA